MADRRAGGILRALGPGLLFAAAAVGVSHLVQSTRAGAQYGLALIGLIVLANAIKYPAFRLGPHYAAATGTSLLEGYRRQGRWALVLYGLLTLGTMFTVQAAVTFTTAGLAIAGLGLKTNAVLVAAALIAVSSLMLAIGRYQWLDRVIKALVAVLTISTVLATALALPRIDWSGTWILRAEQFDTKTILFLAALIGWMPSAIDVSVWQSLWTLARQNDTGHAPSMRESSIDFHIGYLGTAMLALCFLLMGAGVIHGSGVELAEGAGGFATQVIGLYTSTLGEWSGPIIAIAAFAVMFSTTLTVQDGFPRALAVLIARFRGPEESAGYELDQPFQRRVYWISLGVLAIGSLLVLAVMMKSLKALVDVATTLSFLTAPVLSVLNHRSALGAEVPVERRPPRWLIWASLAGIAFQAAFALYYVYLVVTT
jgi:Mn2+/Fe2+ NRAMP family transporter